MADPGTVGETGADTAQPAELVQTRRGPFLDQLDRGSRILTGKTLRRKQRNQSVTILDCFHFCEIILSEIMIKALCVKILLKLMRSIQII